MNIAFVLMIIDDLELSSIDMMEEMYLLNLLIWGGRDEFILVRNNSIGLY